MENADLAARILAAGGQHGKMIINIKPFSKICPVETHLDCI